jgi:ribosome-binding protein aMBF1 (putative translation factor)
LAEYDALRTAADEDAVDAAVLRRILDDSSQEWAPAQLVKRLIDGEHPVRVWREHRGMRAKELAAAADIASSYLSAIETGKKPGSVSALKRIAAALGVTLDELV